MKCKRYIALLLCALYMAATAAVSLASMTCKCRGMMRAEAELRCTSCCAHCSMTEPFCEGGCLETDCDCDRHSTEIDLYTSSHSDDSEKYVRCVVSELPPSLAAVSPSPEHVPALRQGIVLPPLPIVREIPRTAFGLRAPPVWG